ncbi:dihydroneopterin triphosphate diphosphatase [Herminiimonas fonticola]|uniref:Dihydroneopterin triphosphate pyrophosphatase n=1 Tax=Herminiimonas fonticola TaxID=303380 RepID=A0A4V3BWB6_9BURK|nr:dihydroneopterin triphosphate diphosphatase [Herminiimonas fonticola]RBA25083.1 NUDIX domain [Herminiimonas fonticola]TDN94198.1 dihydroneopterin triphosphate pyrophosphatase [Herminiimonas fonticola]
MNRPYKIPESVLVVIHTAKLEVLLIERADRPGFWQSVTGSKDSVDELFLETAVREVEEETGIAVRNLPEEPERASEVASEITSVSAHVALENLKDWQLSNVYDIYPVWQHRYGPDVTRNTEHVFGLLVPRDIPVVLAPREHLNFMWLPYREAADKCFSASNAEAILMLPKYVDAKG